MNTPRHCLVSALTLVFAGALSAGEIIVAPQPQPASGAARSASEQRDRARSYREEAPAGSTIVVVPEEEGVLSPRGGADARAHDNRSHARQMQSGKDAQEPEIVVPAGDPGTARSRAGELRSRAGGYARGETRATGRTNDGIPVIVCKDAESVAGRIGDDVVSGGILIIMRDGKPTKVRCQ